jgi:PEP-CTERM motif
MKLQSFIILATILGFFSLNSNATAGYLDTGWENITTYDGLSGSYGSQTNTWWNTNEDQEVEPGAAIGQQWDLEGFFLSDGTGDVAANSLAMVGGFDFAYGQGDIGSGDIFIDTDMSNDYYEYVLDLRFRFSKKGENKSTYTVYENTDRRPITYNLTHGGPAGETQGQPWTRKRGGKVVQNNGVRLRNIALNYLSDQTNDQMGGGVKGGPHNAVIVDLSFLGPNFDYNVYNTLECGNDFLKGSSSAAVPEPATIFLLGFGLLGLFGFRKKFGKPKN